MKIAVIGSRDFSNYEMFKECVIKYGIIDKAKEIVTGGAKGADSLAERFARENNIELTVIKPDWSRYGKSAGVARNRNIIEYADFCLAFWDGHSKGTASSINHCKLKGKKVIVVPFTQ
jgi:hypothetical protein